MLRIAKMGGGKMGLRKLIGEYLTELIFGAVLLVCVALSIYFARYISVEFYTGSITQIMNGCIATISLSGVWIMLRHTNGMRVRKIWAGVLFAYAAFATLLLMHLTSFVNMPKHGFVCLEGWEMVVGNFLIWLLLFYLTETLRPGWMNFKRALLQGLPVFVAFALDELFDIDFRVLLAIYPFFLLGFLMRRIKEYRQWCEENYSSMDNIDVQWIVRYIIMYLLDCALFFVLCFDASVATAFTQQWLIILMLGYSTEQILFRNDPWSSIRVRRSLPKQTALMQNPSEEPEQEESQQDSPEVSQDNNAEYRKILEGWMDGEKPYLNPEFRLLDLRQVLPLNRTYLSQFINSEYGCNFYQFVTNYRINEAKRLMIEHPDMQLQEVAEQCGFSSPTVFSRVFAREVGMAPREWNIKNG